MGPWSWLHALQDAGSAQTFPQSNGSGLDMGNSLPSGLSRHLRADSLSEGPDDNAEGCSLSRACHLWRLPQAGLGLGPLLDELCHLPGSHDCDEHCEQLCQLQGECQPGAHNLLPHLVMAICIAISYALIVLFEAPLVHLEKLL